MPDKNQGSNKNQNQNDKEKNQGSSTPGAQNQGAQNQGQRGDQTQGQNRGTTPGAQGVNQGAQGASQGSMGKQQQGSMQGQSRAGNFEDKTQEELLNLAKQQGVMGSTSMSREQLIQALKKQQ
jgi:hypothetical protein